MEKAKKGGKWENVVCIPDFKDTGFHTKSTFQDLKKKLKDVVDFEAR